MSTDNSTNNEAVTSLLEATEKRLLVVDDEPDVLHSIKRFLTHVGYEVETVASGEQAIEQVHQTSFDVIISDLRMPGMNGLQLMRAIREHDLDVPVILITGHPDLCSAMEAIEFGAFRYITKPYDTYELDQMVTSAMKYHRLARIKRAALEILGITHPAGGDRAGIEGSFERGLSSLWIAYQPIVNAKEAQIWGYEALMRTREPTISSPDEFIDIAKRLGRENELGRAVRQAVVSFLADIPRSMSVSINLHSIDLQDDDLYSKDSALAQVAQRIVFEISDRIFLDQIENLRERVQELKDMGFRIALDDLGVGHAGLTNLILLEPELVKIDMALIRNLDRDANKQQLVQALMQACQSLGMHAIAEGVETSAERDTLIQMGCDFHQGYLFGVPS
jgi:EAL domain-containing protein (putative c-di-GMP-specific phosphodiesterase class I)